VVAFPLTFNTANKIAHGIMDNHVASTLARGELEVREGLVVAQALPAGVSKEALGGAGPVLHIAD
jgi:flavoprotein